MSKYFTCRALLGPRIALLIFLQKSLKSKSTTNFTDKYSALDIYLTVLTLPLIGENYESQLN